MSKTPDILETVYSLKERLQVVYDIKDETFAETIKAAEDVLEKIEDLEGEVDKLDDHTDRLNDEIQELKEKIEDLEGQVEDWEGSVWIKGLSMAQAEKVRQFILTEIYPLCADEQKFHIP